MKPTWFLFAGIAAGPLAWALSLGANFALAPVVCTDAAKGYLYLVLLAAFLLCAVGIVFARAALRSVPASSPGTPPPAPHYHFMALSGIVLSAFSILLVAAQTIPTILFAGCE
jgi:hypothetical protein